MWVRRIPWRRKWQPTPVFLFGNSHGRRSLAGYSPRGHKLLDVTERARTHTHFFCEAVSSTRVNQPIRRVPHGFQRMVHNVRAAQRKSTDGLGRADAFHQWGKASAERSSGATAPPSDQPPFLKASASPEIFALWGCSWNLKVNHNP